MIQFSMYHLAAALIALVNYSHAAATAFLAVAAFVAWVLWVRDPDPADADLELYYIRVYRVATLTSKIALGWVVLAGIPLGLPSAGYQWNNLAGNPGVRVTVLVHVLIMLLVGRGAFLWLRLSDRVRRLKLKHGLM